MWVTGANTYDPNINKLLGFEPPSCLVGFLAVGTPKAGRRFERPARDAHTEDRTG